MKRFVLSGAGAALAVKAVTGFAAAALAATVAGVATEAAISGSVDPADWGQQVKATVAACKADLQTGQHGIGDCVSAFAKQHGDLVRAQHPANGTHANGSNKANHNGKGNGQGNGQPRHLPDNAAELADGS